MGRPQQPATEQFNVEGDRLPRSRCSRQVSATPTSVYGVWCTMLCVVVNDQLMAVDHVNSLLNRPQITRPVRPLANSE